MQGKIWEKIAIIYLVVWVPLVFLSAKINQDSLAVVANLLAATAFSLLIVRWIMGRPVQKTEAVETHYDEGNKNILFFLAKVTLTLVSITAWVLAIFFGPGLMDFYDAGLGALILTPMLFLFVGVGVFVFHRYTFGKKMERAKNYHILFKISSFSIASAFLLYLLLHAVR